MGWLVTGSQNSTVRSWLLLARRGAPVGQLAEGPTSHPVSVATEGWPVELAGNRIP